MAEEEGEGGNEKIGGGLHFSLVTFLCLFRGFAGTVTPLRQQVAARLCGAVLVGGGKNGHVVERQAVAVISIRVTCGWIVWLITLRHISVPPSLVCRVTPGTRWPGRSWILDTYST